MCEATLLNELNTFYARFALLNKGYAVTPTLPPEDRTLSVTPADPAVSEYNTLFHWSKILQEADQKICLVHNGNV